MAEGTADNDPSIIDRWLGDQQQWQRTILAYLDSMAKNEDFLVHLGNAMRGSLLAGKPYPTPAAQTASVPATPADDRIDQLHYAVHQIEGQLQDLRMTLEEIRGALARVAAAPTPTAPSSKTALSKPASSKAASSKAASSKIAPSKPVLSPSTASQGARPNAARRGPATTRPPAAARKRQVRG